MPSDWPYGYFGTGAKAPSEPPSNDYAAAVFKLDEDLVQAAYALSKDVVLDDSAAARQFRMNYTSAPANQPPKVIRCDVVSSDTWFAGTALNARARDWTKLLTNGDGIYCMSAQEDNATLEVLARGAVAGKVDMKRVAVVRTASDFGAPYEGQTDADALVNSMQQGGLAPSTANLFKAAGPLIKAVVTDWVTWQKGVPRP
jgi:purine nucleoside permease